MREPPLSYKPLCSEAHTIDKNVLPFERLLAGDLRKLRVYVAADIGAIC